MVAVAASALDNLSEFSHSKENIVNNLSKSSRSKESDPDNLSSEFSHSKETDSNNLSEFAHSKEISNSENLVKDKLPYNFSWLRPGLVAGTNCPTSQSELISIYNTGVRYLVTLSPEYQPKHHNVLPHLLPNLHHVNIFFDDFTAPTMESMVEFEKVCRKARQEGAPLAVHCR